MDGEVLTAFAQFGPAGLIGLMWLMERRAASTRERQLAEAHRLLAERGVAVETLVKIVKDNTRAIVSLEHTQRRLAGMAEELIRSPRAATPDREADAA